MKEGRQTSSYELAFREGLDRVSTGLFRDPGLASALPEETGNSVVGYLLEWACVAQNVGRITLARDALCRLPRQWLLTRIEAIAVQRLDLDEEWEYRRLLEVCEALDASLLKRFVEKGLGSRNPDVREAAVDFMDRDEMDR